jgi:hypothetical protein
MLLEHTAAGLSGNLTRFPLGAIMMATKTAAKVQPFFEVAKKMLLSLGLGAIIDVARRYFKLLVNHSKESISVT